MMAILIALQQKPETAQRLADKFEVNKRTILRDMQALSEMGIPLYATSGPTGGFRLMEGFQLPPLQLDASEALAVLFALHSLTKMADTPFKHARWTAMDKIKAVLPETTLQHVEPMLDRVELAVPERIVKTPHLAALLAFTAASTWLTVMYRSENHRRSLLLLPRKIYAAHGYWYCEAYSATHGEQRTFRVDRFDSIEVAEAPRETNSDASTSPSRPVPDEQWTRIVAKLTYRGALLAEQDIHIGDSVRMISDDSWRLDIHLPLSEWKWALRFFYELGMDAEVLEPSRLREEIADRARQIVERYQEAKA
ncbi:MAG: WYL domain-containing protein [Cohnella sp.]|nr:WYL domain-containing protein [Cohnella sp.]